MARKLSAKAEKAKPEGGIPADELKRVVKEYQRQAAHASEYSGLAGQAVKTAIDRFSIDRKALRFVLGLSKMEEVKRQATIRQTIELAHKLDFFASVDAFDDVIDTMEAIVSEIRNRGSAPRGVDPVVSAALN